ncbi:hypothetical protein JOQ06_013932 [Pogonophryne albipinna]|uniref:Small monomeric GTPase n=1 Tax=Pogonophryne albipinna TaxID=1090488 RepID=A0AAD6A8Z6_9TELE|nr:hypothetical protein JOQ06_013932 [Pogonophryne albipinna]
MYEIKTMRLYPHTHTHASPPAYRGGRFKKEIVVDGQSHLLLIRDEGGPPEAQFALWVDAVIFVFSLEDEISFQTVYHYFSRLANFRNATELPLVLVGTQDAISSANPRVIDNGRARKLSNDLKRCTYYETCATYGLNVERVFQDGPSPIQLTSNTEWASLVGRLLPTVIAGAKPWAISPGPLVRAPSIQDGLPSADPVGLCLPAEWILPRSSPLAITMAYFPVFLCLVVAWSFSGYAIGNPDTLRRRWLPQMV